MAQVSLWEAVQRSADDQDYDQLLVLCDKILLESSGDNLAIECRIQALLALGKYQAVIRAFFAPKTRTSASNETDKLYLAYALYKVNKIEESQAVIDALPAERRMQPQVKQLEAQIAYKSENYKNSLDLYQQLLEAADKSSPFYSELLANYYACHAALALSDKSEFSVSSDNSNMGFEVAYNIAVGLAALERYDQAKEYLNSASVGCNNSLKQAGYSDQEIQEELACIDVQMAYLLQKQSSVDQSRAVYGDILRSKRGDFTTKLVALNNYLSLPGRRHKRSFASQFKWGQMVGDAISTPFKIPAYMKQTLHVNKVLLGQKKFVQPQLGSVSEKYPKDERLFLLQLHRSIVEKAAGANEKSYIIKGCEEFVGGKYSSSPATTLFLAQTYIDNGDKSTAISILKQAKSCTACACLLAHLLTADGKMEEATAISIDLINQTTNVKMLMKVAVFLTQSLLNATQALEILAKLPSQLSDPVIIACRAYASLAANSADAAQQHAALVKVIPEFQQHPPIQLELPTNAKQQRKGKRRHRKKPQPKHYNPDTQPDPERWLPKHLRSSYLKQKKRRGKKHSEVARGPQGAVPTDFAEKPTPAPPASTAATTQSSSSSSKKKKGGKKR